MTQEILKMRNLPNLASSQPVFDPLLYTVCNAAIASRAKCGNCGEHASLAFTLLFANGVSGIAKLAYIKSDHAFVVIFSQDGNWVICDPWANWYVPSNEWPKWAQHIWGAVPTDPLTTQASWDPQGGQTPKPSVSDYMGAAKMQFDFTPESMDLSK